MISTHESYWSRDVTYHWPLTSPLFRIFCGTWNVNGKAPPTSLDNFLLEYEGHGEEEEGGAPVPDIYAIGCVRGWECEGVGCGKEWVKGGCGVWMVTVHVYSIIYIHVHMWLVMCEGVKEDVRVWEGVGEGWMWCVIDDCTYNVYILYVHMYVHVYVCTCICTYIIN